MNAIRSVDDEVHLSTVIGLIFINSCRAKPPLRTFKLSKVNILRNIIIKKSKMRWLVSFVIGS